MRKKIWAISLVFGAIGCGFLIAGGYKMIF
jgi:hypothetical protein